MTSTSSPPPEHSTFGAATPAQSSPTPNAPLLPTLTNEQTLTSLHHRLERLEFLLTGRVNPTANPDLQESLDAATKDPVLATLKELRHEFALLVTDSRAMSDLIKLHENHPTLFPTTAPNSVPPSTQTAIILASASEYHKTASQLSQIEALGIPEPTLSTSLISLLPRIEKAQAKAEEQGKKVAELRERSARVLERWLMVGVEDVNDRFAGWDERIKDINVKVIKKEGAARKRKEEEEE